MFSGLSSANSLPFVIMQILSASSSASSRCYELMMIDLPCLMFLISYQTCLLDSTSRPEVGSSKMIKVGFVTIAIARDSFLFMPPDRWSTLLSLCSVSITVANVSEISISTCSSGKFLISQTRARCSVTVRRSKRTSNYWQRPKFCWTLWMSLVIRLL